MTTLSEDIKRLHDRILQTDADTRYRFQPRLAEAIVELDRAGAPVPPRIRNLNDELLNDAIEARFDNLPV